MPDAQKPQQSEAIPQKFDYEKLREEEVSFYQEGEAEDIGRERKEKYADAGKIEISTQSRTVIENLLDKDIKSLRDKFAVKWFNDNRESIKDAGTPEELAEDEYKIKYVISNWEDFKSYLRGPEYREEFGDKIDNLQTLKMEMARKKDVSSQSPFLLLNYLQKRIDEKET